MRGLFGSIADWPAFYREAYRCLKPGGVMEDYAYSTNFLSDEGLIAPGSPMAEWSKVFWAGGEKFGRTFRVIEDDVQKKGMEAAGFVDVTVWDFKVSSCDSCLLFGGHQGQIPLCGGFTCCLLITIQLSVPSVVGLAIRG